MAGQKCEAAKAKLKDKRPAVKKWRRRFYFIFSPKQKPQKQKIMGENKIKKIRRQYKNKDKRRHVKDADAKE